MHSTSVRSLLSHVVATVMTVVMAFSMTPLTAFAQGDSTTADTSSTEVATTSQSNESTDDAATTSDAATTEDATTADAVTTTDAATTDTSKVAATTETSGSTSSDAQVASEDTYYKVTFVSNGATVSTATVESGDMVNEPASPAVPDGYSAFTGWTLDGAAYDFSTPVTSDITLEAQFSKKCLVNYTDAAGKVISSEQVDSGTVLTEKTFATDVLVAPAGEEFDCWTVDGQEYDFSSTVTDDITLVPHFKTTSNVTFVINYITKGSAANPQVVTDGSTAVQPSDPTREGYTFKYWSATDGGSEFDFANTPITSDTVLYAVWEANDVSYTVVYWEEKAGITGDPGKTTSNYEYHSSETKTAKAGSTVTATKADCATIDYFDFSYADSKTVAGTGTTVVNVYYTRTLYTITFDLNGGTMLFKGNMYNDNNQYSFTAKYQQDITNLWPSSQNATFTNGTNGFRGWTVDNASYYYATQRIEMSAEILKDAANDGYGTKVDMLCTAYWSATRDVQVNYWLQQIDGEASGEETTKIDGVTYEKSSTYSQALQMATNSHLVAKAIEGFTNVLALYNPDSTGTSTTNASTATEFDFYYTRDAFDLTFDSQGGSDVTGTDDIQYGASLSKYKPADPTRANYKFKEWTYDAEGKLPVDFTSAKMSQNDLHLFAQWEPSEYNATFYTSLTDATVAATEGIAQDGYVKDPNVYTVGQGYEGLGEFQGWYWYLPSATNYYTDYFWETPVSGNVTLYGQWRTDGFKVTYDAGDGSGTVPTDSNEYALDTLASVQDGSGLTAPEGKVFVGWAIAGQTNTYYPGSTVTMDDDVTLVAKYVDEDNAVTLTYDENFPNCTGTQSVTVEKNDAVTISANMFTAAHADGTHNYTFANWTTTAEALPASEDATPSTAYNAGDTARFSTDTILYANWDKDATVTYHWTGSVPDGATLPGIANVTPGDAYTAASVAAESGYTFSGWYTDEACTTAYVDGTTIDADTDLYGMWAKSAEPSAETTVTYHWVGTAPDGATLPDSATVTAGDTYDAATVAAVSGYTFSGWYTDEACTTAYVDGTAVESDLNLYGTWTKDAEPSSSSTVTYHWVGTAPDGATLPDSTTVTTGDAYDAATVAAVSGYTFSGWYTDEACTTAYVDGTAISADTDLYGKWTKDTTVEQVSDDTTTSTTETTSTTSSALPKTGDALDTQLLLSAFIAVIAMGAIVLGRRRKQQD